jgi:pyrroline-5-carboxylate reductase
VEYTVKGAAELLLATGAEPQTEIDKVTTPGGMTQKGLAAMEKAGFSQAVADGLHACLK